MKPAELCDWLVSRGIATITTEACAHLLGVPSSGVPQRLVRLRAKGQLVALARGLWAVVPAEYRSAGAPDPMRYIDDLMSFYGCEYCVGWLSAAALHGASHQAPQAFQVAVGRQVRNRVVGRADLRFYERAYASRLSTGKVTLSAGSATVASTGATMLMVAADPLLGGGIDNAATVIVELAEENEGYLADVVRNAPLFPGSAACRVGWMLENLAGAEGLNELAAYCRSTGDPKLLSPGGARSGTLDKRWNILVNRKVDPDV